MAVASSAAARAPACHAFWLTDLARAAVAFLASKVAAASSFPSLAIVATYPLHVATSAATLETLTAHGALALAAVATVTFPLATEAAFVSEVSIALTADSDFLTARARVCAV